MSDKFAWQKMARAKAAKRAKGPKWPSTPCPKWTPPLTKKKKKRLAKRKRQKCKPAKVMPFGRYTGLKFGKIPPDYLRWIIREIKDFPSVVKAASIALNMYKPTERIGREYISADSKEVPF